jgi:hypothetical protein
MGLEEVEREWLAEMQKLNTVRLRLNYWSEQIEHGVLGLKERCYKRQPSRKS